jgi:hypothetical protein
MKNEAEERQINLPIEGREGLTIDNGNFTSYFAPLSLSSVAADALQQLLFYVGSTMAGRPPLAQRQVIDPEELDQRQQGNYFATYDTFWNVQQTQISLNRGGDFDALGSIRRREMPKMYEPAFSADQLRKDLTQSDRSGQSENSSEASNSSETEAPTDLLGHRIYEKAHIIGSKCYEFVAEVALGLRNSSAETRLKLVNGVARTVGNNGKTERVKQSGLKHNKYNKLRLKFQKRAIENSPFLPIIPILSLSEVLDWDESDATKDYSYDVMICAGAGARVEAIYAELFQNHRGPGTECTPQDIQTATELLSTFARAIATSTFHDSIMESMTSANKTQSCSVANVIDRIDRASRDGHAEVDLPVLNTAVVDLENPAAIEGLRVKARVTRRTSLPDPYLVAVKAAANWFSGREQKMFAAASLYDSGSDTDSSDYNDMRSSPPPTLSDDPLVNLRNSLSSSSHVTVELFSID